MHKKNPGIYLTDARVYDSVLQMGIATTGTTRALFGGQLHRQVLLNGIEWICLSTVEHKMILL